MSQKDILNAVLEAFPEKDYDIHINNTEKLIRVDLKGYSLEADQIDTLYKIHPFRIMLNEPGSLSKKTFILYFDMSQFKLL